MSMVMGINNDHSLIDSWRKEAPTQIDVHPDSAAREASAQGMFGEDGLTFGDVLDAINPLNHIPIVSDIYADAVGHKASVGSRMVGGTLLGGPIGFVASLAGVIFEEATGQSPAKAAYAALSGEQSTQLAQADGPTPQPPAAIVRATAETKTPHQQLASLEPRALPVAATKSDSAILELYGDSRSSAHDSYRKAQMRSYLHDVTVSKTI